ncbi:MAG: alternative ribosome rescue aminoacyl-tRNA hydrolase ArfB [Planctomycetota bacterium]
MSEPTPVRRDGDLALDSVHAIAADELSVTFVRSSGPGGQNVNKVATKAVLRWNVTASASLPEGLRRRVAERLASRLTKAGELILEGDRYRDQARNRADVRDRLRAIVRDAMTVPKARRPTRPTRGSKERRLRQKKRQSEKKALRRSPPS